MNRVRDRLQPWTLSVGFLCGLSGCVDQQWLAQQTPAAPPPYVKPAAPSAGGIQQVAGRFTSPQQARVEEVGRKLLEANKQLALKPRLEVPATANLEISHQGDHRLSISEGMVNACATDSQLAAVLASELGRMVAERQVRQNAQALEEDRLPPLEVPIGPDGGGYGNQSRQAELAKLGFNRRKNDAPLPTPDADALGQQILARAGFPASEFSAVAALREPAPPSGR
jgi:predicted Zn-dependent protease